MRCLQQLLIKKRFVCLQMLLAMLLSGLVGAAWAAPVVVTTIPPLGFLVEAVVQDKGQVETLLSNNVSPHHYSLSISERKKLAEADLVVWVGAELESGFSRSLGLRKKALLTALKVEGIHRLAHHEHQGHDEHHAHGDQDPHVWLNPLNLQALTDALVTHLVKIAPDYADDYRRQGQQVKQALAMIDSQLTQRLQPMQHTPFIVAHPAYGHFVARYQLQQLDYVALTPERHSGARHLAQLRQLSAAKCVFYDRGIVKRRTQQLAKDLQVPLLPLSLFGGDMHSANDDKLGAYFFQLADEFEACLGKLK